MEKPKQFFLLLAAVLFGAAVVLLAAVQSANATNAPWRAGQTCCRGCQYVSNCCCNPRDALPVTKKTTTTRYVTQTSVLRKTVTSAGGTARVRSPARRLGHNVLSNEGLAALEHRSLDEDSVVSQATVPAQDQSLDAEPNVGFPLETDVEHSRGDEPLNVDLGRRHLCPRCPSGITLVPANKFKSNGQAPQVCCPARKTFLITHTKSMIKVIKSTRTILTTVTAPAKVPVLIAGTVYADKAQTIPAANVALALVDYSVKKSKRVHLEARGSPAIIATGTSNGTGFFTFSATALPRAQLGVAQQSNIATPLYEATVGPNGLDDAAANLKIVIPRASSMTVLAKVNSTTGASQPTTAGAGAGATTAASAITSVKSFTTAQPTTAAAPVTTAAPAIASAKSGTTALAGFTTTAPINSPTTTTPAGLGGTTTAAPTTTATLAQTTSATADAASTTTVTTKALVRGEQIFSITNGGTFTVPTDVDHISFVCVGQGGIYGNTDNGGGGGALVYVNSLPVTPGDTYDVSNNGAGTGLTGNGIIGTCYAGAGESYPAGYTGGVGGVAACTLTDGALTVVMHNGGAGGDSYTDLSDRWGSGSGGAAGYNGTGGAGQSYLGSFTPPIAGSGAGAGGAKGTMYNTGGQGGGVGLFGLGATGTSVSQAGSGGTGGKFGGGGHMTPGEKGACRIIWPGDSRTFPSTDVGPS